MPRSRVESSVVAVGVAALALLVWFGVHGWQRYHAPGASHAVTQPRAGVEAARASAPARRPPGKLTLTAARGNCWLVVKAGSPSGRPLYMGVLVKSQSVTVSGGRFWMSLGAASNVDASFNGRPIQDFPTGTVTLALDGGRVRTG